jgi:hypothetical protein
MVLLVAVSGDVGSVSFSGRHVFLDGGFLRPAGPA